MLSAFNEVKEAGSNEAAPAVAAYRKKFRLFMNLIDLLFKYIHYSCNTDP